MLPFSNTDNNTKVGSQSNQQDTIHFTAEYTVKFTLCQTPSSQWNDKALI